MLRTDRLAFEIAGVSMLYNYDRNIVVSDDWPIIPFLSDKHDDFDVVNDIVFDSSYDLSWMMHQKPIAATPSYVIYIRNDVPTVVYTPNVLYPIAVSLLLDGFKKVQTYVLDDSYSGHPLPICITGYLLQGILATNNLGFIMHGATWTNEEKTTGFVFTGNSGVGKSTISDIFRNNTNYKQISDDRVIIKRDTQKDGYLAWGNPFDIKNIRVSNDSAQLRTFFFLHHSPENKLVRIENIDKVKRMLTISLLPYWDKSLLRGSSKMIVELLHEVEMYDLYFKPDAEVISLIEEKL